METNHRINSIDIARLFAVILVIAIHTSDYVALRSRQRQYSDTAPRGCSIFLLHQRLFSSKRLCPEGLLRYFGYSFETDKSICFCIAGLFCLYILQ